MDSGCDSSSQVAFSETVTDVEKRDSDAEAPLSATAKAGKNGGSREIGHSLLNTVNKCALQIRKTPRRRSASPLNWFPRKKTDSFLNRKIRLLQEVGGMNSSLDETLGDANPHYSRIAKEKIAARQAANKAMEARKAAMVEASWCRILHAARIQSKVAEAELKKAEKCAAEAFDAASRMGVMMYDRPDCPRQPCEIESSSITGGKSTHTKVAEVESEKAEKCAAEAFEAALRMGVTMYDRPDCPRQPCDIESSSITGGKSTHTVAASFETGFEVDKEVAVAVKKAFVRLANCPSSNKEEFRDLLHKISQNPDTNETDQELSEISESESDTGSELEPENQAASFSCSDVTEKPDVELNQKCKSRQLLTSSNIKSSKSFALVDMMLDRMRGLQEDELSSLAIIVATCGLNAALLEMEKDKHQDPKSHVRGISGPRAPLPRRISSLGVGTRRYSSLLDSQMRNKEAEIELPSLDKFLVKHVSRLEREVQEARDLKKSNSAVEEGRSFCEGPELQHSKTELAETDLGSILVKRVSRFERDIQLAKDLMKSNVENGTTIEPSEVKVPVGVQRNSNVSLVKDIDEKTNEEECNGTVIPSCSDRKQLDKENLDSNRFTSKDSLGSKRMSRIERAKLEALEAFSVKDGTGKNERQEHIGLDKILVRPIHWLEREKAAWSARVVVERRRERDQKKLEKNEASLDEILVKHHSKLEREKAAWSANGGVVVERRERDQKKLEKNEASLDEILVKHHSKLEKAKLAAAEQPNEHIKHVDVRREARERELQEAWGGLSLGNSIKPHISRIERDKAAWRKAEEEERRARV